MRFASALVGLLLATALVHAGDAPAPEPPDPRSELDAQVAEQVQTIDQALATVGDKLSAADAQRLRRVRAAYRILRSPLRSDASASDRMASARRRAAARLLLERDRAERTLLADELTELTAARTTKITASAQIPTLVLPEQIERPAKGKIARRFGTFKHDRSRAKLSRRGIDIETERHASARAPAEGTVRYAGPIRGLDEGVILDHGDYLTVVAKLDGVTIPVGVRVARGDVLGRAARRRIYLEVRAKIGPGGLPIDPEPLLAD